MLCIVDKGWCLWLCREKKKKKKRTAAESWVPDGHLSVEWRHLLPNEHRIPSGWNWHGWWGWWWCLNEKLPVHLSTSALLLPLTLLALLTTFCRFSLFLLMKAHCSPCLTKMWYICIQCVNASYFSSYNARYLNKWSGLNVFCDSCICLQSCLILYEKKKNSGSKKYSPARLKELFNYRVQWGAHQSGFY